MSSSVPNVVLALFVSVPLARMADADVRAAIAEAFRNASEWRKTAEPVDWEECRFPVRWRTADGEKTYTWK